jgi:hypothetical protein
MPFIIGDINCRGSVRMSRIWSVIAWSQALCNARASSNYSDFLKRHLRCQSSTKFSEVNVRHFYVTLITKIFLTFLLTPLSLLHFHYMKMHRLLSSLQRRPLNRNESGRFGALKSDSTHHFFRNACTKSGSLRFSVFRLLSWLPYLYYIFTIWKCIVYYRLCRDGIYFDKILVSKYKLFKRSNKAIFFYSPGPVACFSDGLFYWRHRYFVPPCTQTCLISIHVVISGL